MMQSWQKGLGKWARWWNIQIEVNPTQVCDQLGRPIIYMEVQKLEATHIDQRREFCEWILQQPDDFAYLVLWSNDKWWYLHQPNNHQNDHMWKACNPHKIKPNKVQGDSFNFL